MNNLTWEQFVHNVQGWAKERGIYDHSTPTAQLFKAVSEMGEVADAIIKGRKVDLKDGIGDVAVCLVNYWAMMEKDPEEPDLITYSHRGVDLPSRQWFLNSRVANMLFYICQLIHGNHAQLLQSNQVFTDLKNIAEVSDLDFMACCTSAWEEIKDRKGRMVAGGAFVKESEDD